MKNHLCVFVNGLVENPAFNSQSKEALTSKDSQFGSVPKISDAGLKTLEKSEIVDRWGLLWVCEKKDERLLFDASACPSVSLDGCRSSQLPFPAVSV